MEINQTNIKAFITYLYKSYVGRSPNNDELESWQGLDTQDIQIYLDQLYENWQFSKDKIEQVKLDFQKAQFNEDSQREHVSPATPSFDEQESEGQMNDVDFYPETSTSHNKTKRIIVWLLMAPIILISAFLLFKYSKYKNLNFLYVTTDNVAIRDKEGKTIGRMDIFASESNNSVSFLRTSGTQTYPIIVNNKTYQCRQVLTDSTSFGDYLFNRSDAFAYVNENYVIDNKDDFIIYRNVFKAIINTPNEGSALTAKYKNTIIGSMKKQKELLQYFVTNSCDNTSKSFTSILKYKTNDNLYQVIAQLSNGKYYVFSGNPDKDTYYEPRTFNYKVSGSNEFYPCENENLLFKFDNNSFFIFDCAKNPREYFVSTDQNGFIQYAKYSFDL